jgi:hypothetical protein
MAPPTRPLQYLHSLPIECGWKSGAGLPGCRARHARGSVAGQTVPSQLRQSPERPTTRWMFQCFEGISLVRFPPPCGPPYQEIAGLADWARQAGCAGSRWCVVCACGDGRHAAHEERVVVRRLVRQVRGCGQSWDRFERGVGHTGLAGRAATSLTSATRGS